MGSVVSTIGSALGLKNAFKTPTPPAAIPPATTAAPAVQQAAAAAARRRAMASGYQSTILTQNYMAPATTQLKQTVGS